MVVLAVLWPSVLHMSNEDNSESYSQPPKFKGHRVVEMFEPKKDKPRRQPTAAEIMCGKCTGIMKILSCIPMEQCGQPCDIVCIMLGIIMQHNAAWQPS